MVLETMEVFILTSGRVMVAVMMVAGDRGWGSDGGSGHVWDNCREGSVGDSCCGGDRNGCGGWGDGGGGGHIWEGCGAVNTGDGCWGLCSSTAAVAVWWPREAWSRL